MTQSNSHSARSPRERERGGATVKFLAVIIAIFLVAHAGFNYIMVWYQCTQFKEAMIESVTQAYAMPNSNLNVPENLLKKLRAVGNEDGVPANAVIKVEKQAAGMQARASFVREIDLLPFNLYKYNYQFDYLAVPPSGFASK